MEPNCVHYLVYFDDAPSPDDSTLLETRKEEVHEFSNWIVQRKLMDKKNAAPLTQAEHPPRGRRRRLKSGTVGIESDFNWTSRTARTPRDGA